MRDQNSLKNKPHKKICQVTHKNMISLEHSEAFPPESWALGYTQVEVHTLQTFIMCFALKAFKKYRNIFLKVFTNFTHLPCKS